MTMRKLGWCGIWLQVRWTSQNVHYTPFSFWQRPFLVLGSASMALLNPSRQDMVAMLGDVTSSECLLKSLRTDMLKSEEGRAVLSERPDIHSTTLPQFDELRRLPTDTLGHAYVKFLDQQKVSPDTRVPVRFIQDDELAYILQRYRQVHDFFHVVTGLDNISLEHELALKMFEAIHMKLPVAVISAIVGPLRADHPTRQRLWSTYLPWAWKNARRCQPLLSVYYEKHLTTPLADLRRQWQLDAVEGRSASV